MPVKGIIFDFDGVLVDTEWAIYQSWVHLFRREGQTIDIETYSPCLGAGYSHWNPADYLESLTGKKYDWEVETPARQAMLEADLERMGLMPGAAELLQWCKEHDIPMAVASSSSRRWVAGWLEKLGIMDYFKGVFTRTDGFPVKPNPALFLAARECLDVPPEHCIIIEDSENGTISAARAGIPCVAIPNRMTKASDFSAATEQMSDLHQLLKSISA
ncbi:MAG: HAD-IA family hydrolase [Akkermansia sp.]|nr:HAD-IA family hydrolase [Akkermansia sp.]